MIYSCENIFCQIYYFLFFYLHRNNNNLQNKIQVLKFWLDSLRLGKSFFRAYGWFNFKIYIFINDNSSISECEQMQLSCPIRIQVQSSNILTINKFDHHSGEYNGPIISVNEWLHLPRSLRWNILLTLYKLWVFP